MAAKMTTILVLSVVLSVPGGLSQAKKVTFDGNAALEYTRVLSSDAMVGRMSGEPGGQMAAEYIVSKLKEWGLEPAGPQGSYYQDMTYEYYMPERGASLGIIAHNRNREFLHGEDWRQYQYSGSGTFGADIVFLGYGISAPQKDYDDYAGVNVKDKLVLFSIDTPGRFQEKLGDEAQLHNRIQAAQQHGARGVLTFRSDGQPAGAFFRGGLKKELYRADFVILALETKVVDFMFKWQKADPRYFFQQIEATGTPQSYDMNVQGLVNLKVTFDPKRPTQNVLAKISGTDEKLKHEYVVVGAHMDHLGVDMAGDVLNGADDNASGTAVVMETARVFQMNRFQPRRTVIFALWAAEEEGLLGSKFYSENPVYPLEKTVANINLDMEGHGTGKVNARGAYYAPEVWEVLKGRLPKEVMDNTIPGRGGPGGSDHTHFLYNGVPAFMVSTDGPHFKTNRVGDVIGLIQPQILKNSGDFVVAATEVLATEPGVPITSRRKETFQWRYQTIANHTPQPLDAVIEARGDVQDPDVDIQLAVIGEKQGLTGDASRLEVLRNLLAGKEKLAQTKGLSLHGAGGPAPAGGRMLGPAAPSKTTVVAGLRGIGVLRDDLRWGEVFSKQGASFLVLDQPQFMFGPKGMSDEGKKVLDALAKANLLLIVRGLDPAQTRALLETTAKPVFLHSATAPGNDIVELVRKTRSVVGLIFARDEKAVSYFARMDSAKKAAGADHLAIVCDHDLWDTAGKEQMLQLIAEMIRARYENEDLANLLSGSFMRALRQAAGN